MLTLFRRLFKRPRREPMIAGTGSLVLRPNELAAAESSLWARYGSTMSAPYQWNRSMLPPIPARGTDDIKIGPVQWELYPDGEMRITIKPRTGSLRNTRYARR